MEPQLEAGRTGHADGPPEHGQLTIDPLPGMAGAVFLTRKLEKAAKELETGRKLWARANPRIFLKHLLGIRQRLEAMSSIGDYVPCGRWRLVRHYASCQKMIGNMRGVGRGCTPRPGRTR